jgi:acyl-CoA hydrolase
MKAFSVKFDHSIALIRRVIYAGSTSIHLALAMVVLSLSDLAAISLRDYLIVSITSYK